MSCHYITSELEEIEREDNFRLKRFKELKIKKNKEKEEVNKKDTCSCQKFKTGDGPEPYCMSSDKNKQHTQKEVPANICCKENKEVDIFSSSQTESLSENNEFYQQDKGHSKPDNRYIFAACNSTAIEEEDKGPCVCLSPSSQAKPNFQRNIGAEGDTEKHEYIFASCKKTKKPSSSCNSIKTKQSEMSNVKSQMADELDKTCSCEILETNKSDESICICEPLENADKEESICSCTLLKNPDIELVCSCEQLNKPIGKEFKVSFADKTIQTDIRKYSNTPRKESCQRKSTKVAVSFNDEQKPINDKYDSSCQPFKPSFDDKTPQIGYLSDSICSCTASIKDGNKNDYIFSSCKKRVKGVHSDIPSHANANDNVKSGICCSKSANKESMIRNTKSDQIRYSKPTIENEHYKPVCYEPVKTQNKVSFQDKEIQTGFESDFPCKTLASSISSKNKMGSSEVGEYMRTFKEIVKVTKKPDKNGNMREERRMKTVKTEKNIISDPIVSKKSYKLVSRTPSTSSTGSSNTARKPCEKDTSTLTIVSQPISNDSSQPVSESESLVQEVNFNIGDKSSNCSSKSLQSSMSHFKSCESPKSASSSYRSHNKRSDRLKPASNRLKVKIVSKPDEDSKQNNINETKFELTPSTFNLIKLILLGLSKSEASNKSSKIHQDQNKRSAKFSSGSKQKDDLIQKNVSYRSCSSEADKPEPSTVITRCSCKNTNSDLKSMLSQSCDNIRENLVNDFKTNHFGNKSRSLPIIDTPNCTCAKNVKEKPPLLQTTCDTKHLECSCQKNKTSPKFSCSSVSEVENKLSSCSCSKVHEAPSKTSPCNCKNEKFETERKSWKCKQNLSNDSCEQESDKSFSESSRSTKSISDSRKICQSCNQQLSSTSSIFKASPNESNFSFKKSLRFSDSLQNKCNESCSCSSQIKSNNSFKSCYSKPYQSSDSATSQSQNSSKCLTTKVDASTSTRRSDKYDCRPLRLFMDKKQADCSSKSDTIILRVYKNSDSSYKQINRCRSFNDDDKKYFKR